MAVGDKVYFGPTSVLAGEFLNLQPAAGVEVTVHNIVHEAGVELYFFDGTNSVLCDSDFDGGRWAQEFLNCSNTKYYRVKNIDTVARLIVADGVQTK